MPADFLSFLSTPLGLLGAIFFLGLSIFVHELGHYLAARWRGLQVERFSIGFGPKIVSWKIDGVEWRLSWLPLGGYVALPQMADMTGLEGKTDVEGMAALPPVKTRDKIIVAVAGAFFNVLFAFALATALWAAGTPVDGSFRSTTIGYVAPTFPADENQPNGERIPTPAATAGLLAGDVILAVDGRPVQTFADIRSGILLSSGRDAEGRRQLLLRIRRDGTERDITVFPVLRGDEQLRMIGISPAMPFVVGRVFENSPAALAGVVPGDELIARDGQPLLSPNAFAAFIEGQPTASAQYTFRRADGTTFTVPLTPVQVPFNTAGETLADVGLRPRQVFATEHIDPFTRLGDDLRMTVNVLLAVFSPGSDIKLQHMSGPVGITNILFQAVLLDWKFLFGLLVLINVNLAVMNLLPIPVLDGGHILFALIAKLRGKPLPIRVLQTVQVAFVLCFLGLFAVVAYFDVNRVARQVADDSEARENATRFIPLVFPAPAADKPVGD